MAIGTAGFKRTVHLLITPQNNKQVKEAGREKTSEEEEEEPEAVEDRQQSPSWASPCDKDAINHPSTGEISTTRVAGDVNKEPPCHLRQSLTMTN
ncbi:hypothetical protein CEXT_33291 [Caerostris extrusa]|uniref:Uncharacterized protein n=1 Tax=Caerostris extrusa TaxID=172846 RepID=A0AAV4T611_CAEEX|nr:hypothetical protein CEXT_33291 [Caerostris extrusa]